MKIWETVIVIGAFFIMAAGIWYLYNSRQDVELELQRSKQQVTALTNKIEEARIRKNINQARVREERRILSPPEGHRNMDGRTSDLDDSATTTYVNACQICYDAEVDSVIFPCRHSMSCLKCSLKMESDGECNFCRQQISNVEAIFIES